MSSAVPGTPLVVTVTANIVFTFPPEKATSTLTPWVLNGTQVIVVGACAGPAAPVCMLDAQGLGRHFLVQGGGTLGLYNLVLANGATFGTNNPNAFATLWANWELSSGGAVGLQHLGGPGTRR